MLTLYVKTGCSYCEIVKDSLFKLRLDYREKNISDLEVATELIEKGGKKLVPFIDDEDPCTTARHHTPCLLDGDVEMYESNNIIEYLEKNYGTVVSK